MKDYWVKIEKKVGEITNVGDRLVCRSISSIPGSTCQLCGYHPISWVHSLWNPRTNEELKVGSECVINYKKIFFMITGKNLRFVFPVKFKNHAAAFNEREPGAIEVARIPDIDVHLNKWQEDDEEWILHQYEGEWGQGYESISDLAPEGLGVDEIDWDSLDYS